MTRHHLWIKYIYGVWHSHSCDLRQNKVFQPENLFILRDLFLRILFHHQPHLIQRVKARHSTKYQPVHHCRCWWRPQACGCRGCRRWRRQEGQGSHKCQWWPHSSRAPHVWPPIKEHSSSSFWSQCSPLGCLWRQPACPSFQRQGPVCTGHDRTRWRVLTWGLLNLPREHWPWTDTEGFWWRTPRRHRC